MSKEHEIVTEVFEQAQRTGGRPKAVLSELARARNLKLSEAEEFRILHRIGPMVQAAQRARKEEETATAPKADTSPEMTDTTKLNPEDKKTSTHNPSSAVTLSAEQLQQMMQGVAEKVGENVVKTMIGRDVGGDIDLGKVKLADTKVAKQLQLNAYTLIYHKMAVEMGYKGDLAEFLDDCARRWAKSQGRQIGIIVDTDSGE